MSPVREAGVLMPLPELLAPSCGSPLHRMTGALIQFGTSAAELASSADELYSIPGTRKDGQR